MQGIIIIVCIVGAVVFTCIKTEKYIIKHGGKTEWITDKIFTK